MTLPEQISVGNKTYSTSIFVIQAQASCAKGIVFAAEADVAITNSQYIWAAIANYYALFHLASRLMLLVPTLVEPALLERLIKKRTDGTSDPTSEIRHSDIPMFLKRCEASGLTVDLGHQFALAKNIREEYANYGPRTVWRDERATFVHLACTPEDVRGVTSAIPTPP